LSTQCFECGSPDCPCPECHGQGPTTVDQYDHIRGRHIQIDIDCGTCSQNAEEAAAEAANQEKWDRGLK
jgi:hypothetical protein